MRPREKKFHLKELRYIYTYGEICDAYSETHVKARYNSSKIQSEEIQVKICQWRSFLKSVSDVVFWNLAAS